MCALYQGVKIYENSTVKLQLLDEDEFGRFGQAVTTDELELKINCCGQYELIKLWRKGTGEDGSGKKYDSDMLYAFIPAGVVKEEICLYYDDYTIKVFLDDKKYASGEYIKDIEWNKEYNLLVEREGECEYSRLIFVQSKNLPVAFLMTESGSTTTLRANKENIEKGTFQLIANNGEVEYDGDLEWVSGRGNSSWSFEKRGYAIKLREETDLLNMGAAKKWVLLANAFDESNGLRNQMAYDLARKVGMEYSCELQFIDLYINKVYAGTYQLCEKIEVSENRLDIGYLDEANEEINPGLDSLEGTYTDGLGLDIKTPQDYSGGYILERNYGNKLVDKPFYFTTKGNEGFVIREPSRVSDIEMQYIKDCMQGVENALLSEYGIDKISGKHYSELIDMDSWAKKFLINVITKGESIGETSSYFYKKQGDSYIYAGPAWDFDKSFGRQSSIADTDVLMDNFGETIWWSSLYQKEEFYDLVVEYYWKDFRPYLEIMIEQNIDEWAEYISDSYIMNWLRWPESAQEYDFIEGTGKANEQSFIIAQNYLKDWLFLRMSYLDSIWTIEK